VFPQTPNTPRSKISNTPKVKVDLGSNSKSVFSREYEERVAKIKKEQFAKDRDFFDICDPMSSVIFDKCEKLIKKHTEVRKMCFEDVEKFLKQSISSKAKKSVFKVKPKVSTPNVEKVVLADNVYQKKTFSKQQVWKPKESATSSSTGVCGNASSSPSGEWVDVIRHDTHGKPKTVRAWVPYAN